MKSIFVYLSLWFICANLCVHKLTGKVVDENNGPLIGATVYFDGTTRGVITNKPILVITYLGYQNVYLIGDLSKYRVFRMLPLNFGIRMNFEFKNKY